MDEKVGCAWVFFRKEEQVPYLQQTIRLSSDTSVFRSESIALLEVSAFASKLPGSTIIFTESKSNLEAMENASWTNPEIAQLFTILQVNPKITIQWIPGHSGIPGNDIVDLVAKWSAVSPVLPIVTPAKTAKSYIQDVVQRNVRKLSSLSATVTSFCNNETANTISHRSLIRFHSVTFPKYNTYPTSNGYFQLERLINRADTPKCQCGFKNETIAHFLLYCPMYRAQRRVLHNNITKIAGRSASPLKTQMHSINFGFRRRGQARTNSHSICF
jgi:ribonuclease HI